MESLACTASEKVETFNKKISMNSLEVVLVLFQRMFLTLKILQIKT